MALKIYIYQQKNWPNFEWNISEILELLTNVRNRQGRLLGRIETLGFKLKDEALLQTLTTDILKSTEIEGSILDEHEVRSSVAKRLGLEIGGLTSVSAEVEGVVDMILDATINYDKPLTKERLLDWHASLFPRGKSGMYKIKTGAWRDDSAGPMQVVSGAMGKEKVHFQAPPAESLEKEMNNFLNWFNDDRKIDLVLKAGIAHIWFVTLHPFEDGNGRIARAITDMLLARSDGVRQRYYSMSAQIEKERKKYYEILEQTQKGTLDITNWLSWFLETLLKSIENSEKILSSVIKKHEFWNLHGDKIKNERQRKVLNLLLSNFTGNLTSSKWAKITKCSQDTALRDIQDLMNKGILVKSNSGGRSTNYKLKDF